MPRYRSLTREQRYTIESMICNRRSQKKVAEIIDVSESTVSRELRSGGMERTCYSCIRAEDHARSRPWHCYRVPNDLLDQVEARLREDWSPEQISRTFARAGIGSVGHETQHIYQGKRRGRDLRCHQRHRCKSSRKRGAGRERGRRLKNQVKIDQRPDVVGDRSRIGDWELDTVIGKPGGPVLVTMVERRSRYTLIGLAENKEALEVGAAILGAMRGLRDKILTLTYDNGKEFAPHELLGELLGADRYFTHPYRSWGRSLNENTNGLNRQSFPRATISMRLLPMKFQQSRASSTPVPANASTIKLPMISSMRRRRLRRPLESAHETYLPRQSYKFWN